MSKIKKAVVFGGTGFLGSNVADALTENGFLVRIFDCDESPYIYGNQEMIIGDIMDMEEVIAAVQDADVVYHFAGIADISEANQKPIEAGKYNSLGTGNILDACAQKKLPRFVLADRNSHE